MRPGMRRQVERMERTLRQEEGRCHTCGRLHFGDYVSAALCAADRQEPAEEPCRCGCCRALWRRLERDTLEKAEELGTES